MPFSISTLGICAVLLAASGCKNTATLAPPPVSDGSSSADQNLAKPIRVTPNGIGPLRADTNPDTELQNLFPQYEVVADSFQAEGDTYTVYRLLKGDETALLIHPWEGRVSEVMVLDPTIQGPYGVHVGATLEEIGSEARSKISRCFFAAEGQERIFCVLDGPTRLQLTFATDGLKIESEKPVEIETLAGRVIQGLRWLPPQ